MIYIANTPNAAYFSQVIRWLTENNDPELRDTLERISNDMANFPRAVSREIADLKSLCSRPQAPAHLVIVTTEGLVQGQLDVQFAGTTESFPAPLQHPLPAGINPVQPLLSPETMDCVLENIAELFSPERCEFILITKSHGNQSLALTSLMAGKLDINESEKLTQALKNARLPHKGITA